MRTLNISVAEWEIMRLLWEQAPLPVSALVKQLAARKGWRSSTTQTLLRRLVAKGAVKAQQGQRPALYEPNLEQAECGSLESQTLVERCFGGKPIEMLVQLVEETPLSAEEIKRLKRLLAKKGE